MVELREWLIRKDGYFYRPDCQGYTTHKHEAGRYTKAKAEAEASVEPWHMSVIHESEWPDDPVSATYKSKDAQIAALTAQVKELKRWQADQVVLIEDTQKLILELQFDKKAAEAENARLRDALERLLNPAPGVKKLPPWVYGIARAALAGEDGR